MANNKSFSEIRFHLARVGRAQTLGEAKCELELADMASDGFAYGELPADIRAAITRAEDTIANWDSLSIVASNGAQNMKACG
jgi:hypothetical protein